MDLYQSYSLFSFLVRSNAVALYVSQGKKNWGGGWKEKAKMSALMLPIDATLRAQVAPGQWRFGRYAFSLKTRCTFSRRVYANLTFLACLHTSTLAPVNSKMALWEAPFPGTSEKAKPTKAKL